MNRNEFFQAMPITKVILRLTNAALEICTDDIEDVHVMASGGKNEMDALRIQTAADTLTIEQPVSALAKSASASSSWLQLTLRLPRNWKGMIDSRTVTGWMNLRSLTGSDLSLDTVSGQIMASDLDFITLSARAVTGDVKLNQVHSDRCSLFTTSGSLTAMRTGLRIGSASTVTGLITLDLVQPFEELTLNSVTGDICVDVPITECDATLRSISGRIRTDGISNMAGGHKLRATTVSSDLDLTCNIE